MHRLYFRRASWKLVRSGRFLYWCFQLGPWLAGFLKVAIWLAKWTSWLIRINKRFSHTLVALWNGNFKFSYDYSSEIFQNSWAVPIWKPQKRFLTLEKKLKLKIQYHYYSVFEKYLVCQTTENKQQVWKLYIINKKGDAVHDHVDI